MTLKLAKLVAWLCTAWLVALPIGALYLLFDLDAFAGIAAANLGLPIKWYTVETAQWLALWFLTAAYAAVGYAGVVFLRRAFLSFAGGDWFNEQNSRFLRRFAALLMIQGIAKPLHYSLASVLLSINHSPGDKVLSISVGSNELILVVAGLVMWVLADLLVEGTRADAENRQFV